MTSKELTALILDSLSSGVIRDVSGLLLELRRKHDVDPTLYVVLLSELEEQKFIQQYQEQDELYVCRSSKLD